MKFGGAPSPQRAAAAASCSDSHAPRGSDHRRDLLGARDQAPDALPVVQRPAGEDRAAGSTRDVNEIFAEKLAETAIQGLRALAEVATTPVDEPLDWATRLEAIRLIVERAIPPACSRIQPLQRTRAGRSRTRSSATLTRQVATAWPCGSCEAGLDVRRVASCVRQYLPERTLGPFHSQRRLTRVSQPTAVTVAWITVPGSFSCHRTNPLRRSASSPGSVACPHWKLSRGPGSW